MSTRNIKGIRPAATANKVVADSVRDRHKKVGAERTRVSDQLVEDLLNADIARRATQQDAIDRLAVLDHEYGQTTFMVGCPPVGSGGHHPLNLRHWSLLQWILAIVLAVLGLFLAWATFDIVADIFGNPMDDWRTVLKIVWASGWFLLGFGLGGLIGYALDPNNRQQR